MGSHNLPDREKRPGANSRAIEIIDRTREGQPSAHWNSHRFKYLRVDVRNCRGAQNRLGLKLVAQGATMLRQAFRDRLKEAMKARDSRTVSTVRLILAGLQERDVAARGQGNLDGLSAAEIQRMLQAMIKQRRESIALYQQGNRPDLAQQESEEIAVIESFLPRQLDEGEIEAAAKAAIDETGATTVKDLGKVMVALRERHGGVIDLGRAGVIVRRLLG